ncbi:MAG: hypothetical protein R3E96_13060 [Planctomycetota bacterium]
MLLFSVRRGSWVIGQPDSIFGIPIEEGDILTTPLPTAMGGVSPFPGIFIAPRTSVWPPCAPARSSATSAMISARSTCSIRRSRTAMATGSKTCWPSPPDSSPTAT